MCQGANGATKGSRRARRQRGGTTGAELDVFAGWTLLELSDLQFHRVTGPPSSLRSCRCSGVSASVWDLDFGFVGDDGRSYDDNCGVVPGELMDVGEMYPDAEADANVCLAVPERADGLWTVAARFTDPVFFAADED